MQVALLHLENTARTITRLQINFLGRQVHFKKNVKSASKTFRRFWGADQKCSSAAPRGSRGLSQGMSPTFAHAGTDSGH